jgi:NADPH-dependent 2,4-dienoyl-CoA reductase/sulfur reductase-like enzyme/nitrite reductase/ring-hydroxylating ferredoxin subunit
MADQPKPDLRQGISVAALQDGDMLLGQVEDEEVLLARSGNEIFAVGAHCTHYHGPLSDGLVVDGTVRCPWHHACFSLRTGEAVRAPALDPIACWRVERSGDQVVVREKLNPADLAHPADLKVRRYGSGESLPSSVVIVGGGAAGLAAADMLRREAYEGPITMMSADDSPPCDRPNLSKDYLAGTAQEDWIPLRPPEFYTDNRIELLLNSRVASIDVARREVLLENGSRRSFGALLIATGAEPIHLPIPGADAPHVHYLRSFADSKAIVQKTQHAKKVVVAGASFIGLEVAASLRNRDIAVDVVAPERVPLERVMGVELGRFIQKLHESHGVVFHLGETVKSIDGRRVSTSGGSTLDADFVVMGVGVRPATALAERAGLTVDRGILVNEYLETSASGIFAAGDVARWLDRRTGEQVRIEHWVVAERQGQTAARNILGRREVFDDVPFFWSQHYDIPINYVGHAERWDGVRVDGSPDAHDCTVTYLRADRKLAVATIYRDRDSLQAELDMERSS